MKRYFGPKGLLTQKVEHFEYRASQLDMAQAVSDCLATSTPLLVEAGTGTGKTWAYLIPALLSGRKVVISTGTKTLQDQILDHDIPFLRQLLNPQLKAVCLKGRKNYLCRRRFRDFTYQPTLWNKDEARLFQRFQHWAKRTRGGDRAEIDWLPDRFQTWNEVSSSSEQCLGQNCADFSQCFITRSRQEAAHAHLVVVNHHLFFANLALRDQGLTEIIPGYDALIFDEAHQLEDTIGLYFGIQFSNVGMVELMHDLLRECRKGSKKEKGLDDPPYPKQLEGLAHQMEVLARRLYHQFSKQEGGSFGRFTLDVERRGPEDLDLWQQIIHALEETSARLTPYSETSPGLESCRRRSLEMVGAAGKFLKQSDDSLVYWYEMTPQAVFLRGTPIDVASVCRERLFGKTPAVVLTSATLSVAGSFQFVKNTLGMPSESKEIVLPSPFAYEKQALLYIPGSGFPTPQDPRFCGSISAQALEILKKTRGRALFLFTSYRHMNTVFQEIRDHLPYPILVQGQKTKRALLAEFREQIHSVLLATSSFWQGIDVPGEALSCLLIDKLPFEVPDDPIIAARMELLSREGKSPFLSYQVPRAIIQLKQGVGRLIRSSQDRGIVVIFDVRLFTKSYGKLFIRSLPPCRVADRLEEMDGFLAGNFVGNGPAVSD